MSERSQKLFLSDIIESIDAIQIYVAGADFDYFCSDRKTFAATIRELEIIGEAIRNISDEIKIMYPDVLWQEIRSFRNKIAHEYFGVDTRIVWDIVQNELDLLKDQIFKILAVIK
jgi:uncharacterized protein with HEPN domain